MASKVESNGLSVISEESKNSVRKQHNDECGLIYNQKSRSAYGGGHKKKLHPLMLGPGRCNPGKLISLHAASKSNLSEFTQRIMSAKLLRVKQVQNQLTETQIQLNELINENRILKNMQKRQEGALKRYEGNHAELPQLIRSHNEEIRALKANNKLIKAQLRESNTKLKERENELEALRDNYNKLKKLSTEKNLLEREKLQRKVEELQEVIKEQEEKIQVLSRKMLLESKNYRHHLNIEVVKHKETQKDLNSALSMIYKLENQLAAKDRILPGVKVQMKRDNKNIPIISNKSTDIQPKLGISEDSFLSRDDRRRKTQMSDSPDSELELLNGLGSSEDTPSPTQDIFPDINKSKKPILEKDSEADKLEMFQLNSDITGRQLGKTRKSFLSKKSSRFSADIEANAKVIADKLSEDMEIIKELAEKVDATSSSNLEKTESISEEVNINTSADTDISDQLEKTSSRVKNDEEENAKPKALNSKRIVPKRKLEEEKQIMKITNGSLNLELDHELTELEHEKLENMSKTWNDMKNKIQEDRMKAEEKLKELKKINFVKNSTDSTSSESESENQNCESKFTEENQLIKQMKKDLRFATIAEDEYILQELEKTDKIFNKLKNETQKPIQKTPTPFSSSADKKSNPNSTPKAKPKQQQNIKSFRTESQREPNYLEEFQSECQKQNLLKALKAIDVGKDPNLSTEESGESDNEKKIDKFYKKNGLKHVKKLSTDKTNKDLMTELFGPRHRLDKNENMALEYGTIAGVND